MLLATLVLVVQAQPYFYEDFQDTDLMDDYQVGRRLQRCSVCTGDECDAQCSRAVTRLLWCMHAPSRALVMY